jgi:hypothetical protein
VDQPKAISQWAFVLLSLCIFVVVVLAVVGGILARLLLPALGIRFETIGLYWLGPVLFFSGWITNKLLKLLGRSRSSKTVEVRGRSATNPEGDIAEDAVVVLHFPQTAMVRGLIASSLAICIAFSACIFFIQQGWIKEMPYDYLATLSLGTLLVCALCAARTPQVCADWNRIGGYRPFHPGQKFVPWSEIATCDIETHYDTFGEPQLIVPVFRDYQGKELLRLNLSLLRLTG